MGATQEGSDPTGFSSQRTARDLTPTAPVTGGSAHTSTLTTTGTATGDATGTGTQTGTETGTETGTGTGEPTEPDAPPEGTFRFVEISGTLMGTGPELGPAPHCEFVSNTYADTAQQTLQVTTGRHDFTADTRIVVYDHASIQDARGDEVGSCGNAVFQGFGADATYLWYRMLEQQRDHTEPIPLVSDGARLMVAGTSLGPGASAILPVSFSWTDPDGNLYEYSGTLTVTYVGDWEVSSVREVDDGQVVGHEPGYGHWLMV
jgi:hypothetical protein